MSAAYLYGSVTRDERPARDIDLGVVSSRPFTRSELDALAQELALARGCVTDLATTRERRQRSSATCVPP